MSSLDGSPGSADLAARGRRKGSPFLVLAAGLLFFAAAVGAAFIVLRPTTLRIAVGPAGSDDLQLVQAMAQTFATEGASVRLAVITTAGPVDSLAALAAGKADLAVGRTDEEMPEGTSSVAIMRKNVVVLWAPAGAPRKAPKKEIKAKIKTIEDPVDIPLQHLLIGSAELFTIANRRRPHGFARTLGHQEPRQLAGSSN